MKIDVGKTDTGKAIPILLGKATRHGLVTGATGTGKTVTLQRLSEGFSRAGVPVFAADVKGDLSGVATPSERSNAAHKRAQELHHHWTPEGFPVEFWDIFGESGLSMHSSVQEMGADMLSTMLRLNETQAGAMSICFKRSVKEQSFMLTMDDLRWELNDMLEERETVCKEYGNVTAASISAIQRSLLALEAQGGDNLFGEPPFDILDLIQTRNGKGVINLLHADKLMEAPKLYSTFLLWLLTQLFKHLPEAGDLDKPKLVFFFDEAHLLFRDAPKPLLQQIERLVRLVRSKGVGVFFVTQSPKDVPEAVLGQLGNRVQHALRAFTPGDRRMIKASADAFRPNEGVNVKEAITEMGTGQALISCLQEDGTPSPVEIVKILPPSGQIGPISDLERETIIEKSDLRSTYGVEIEDNEAHRRFMSRILKRYGIEDLSDGKPVDYEPGFYINHVPKYVEMTEEGSPSLMRRAIVASLAVMFAVTYWMFLGDVLSML